MIAESDLEKLIEPQIQELIQYKFKDYADIRGCLLELLKFLYLSSKYPELKRTFIPVTQEVDEVWHCLILQTVYYQKLCSQLPGSRFIHHESMPFSKYREVKEKGDLVVEILRWIPIYFQNFGELKEDRLKYWFFIRAVKDTLNLSLTEINHFAKDSVRLE